MPSKIHATIAGQLAAAQLVIENTLANPGILERVAARGYTATEMAAGQRLHRVAVAAVDAQAAAAGAARHTTERADAAEKQARASYQELVQTVRAVFPANSSQRKSLEVVGAMPVDTAKFIAVATTLFNNALNVTEISAVLARYGYEEKALRRERELIAAYQQALQAQASAKSAAKLATRAQREALTEMQQWVAQYTKIAKVALRSQPELLKALGIVSQNGHAPARNPKPGSGPQPIMPPQA
jgi:hypothetical protein